MDAPATTSDDNGTSGGGGGWFTPRKKPVPAQGTEREAADGRRLAGMRPVGRATSGTDSGAPTGEAAPNATSQRAEQHGYPEVDEPLARPYVAEAFSRPHTTDPAADGQARPTLGAPAAGDAADAEPTPPIRGTGASPWVRAAETPGGASAPEGVTGSRPPEPQARAHGPGPLGPPQTPQAAPWEVFAVSPAHGAPPAATDVAADHERITQAATSTPAPPSTRTEPLPSDQRTAALTEAPPVPHRVPTQRHAPADHAEPSLFTAGGKSSAAPAPRTEPSTAPAAPHSEPSTAPAAPHSEPSSHPPRPQPQTPSSAPHPQPDAPSAAAPHPHATPTGTAPQAAPSSPAAPHAEPSTTATPQEDASPDAVLIRRTMSTVAPVADKVTSYFYALLFVRHPDLRPLFPAAMDAQRDRLLKALLTAAEHIDNTAVLVPYLQNLGRGHRKYGTQPEHYPAVGECLIGALSRYAESVWDDETEAAWVRAYTTISQVMIDAAATDELRAPAWWYAEVVSHDLRTPDVAVITVRPDQPYPFLAGQYTSLETPWWPRIWRHYSFASAPRSDGLLSFHVKAVPAGWVSNALVHRARPGDVIRLGPPAGSMTVDHTTDSGLLCLGGGTGIAPIKALIEDVAEHGERRPVEVFYGARTDHDLYDIDTMLRLQQTHPWLSVRAIIDQQAHIQLPDAIREYGPWNEYDAYLSGPPGMIRSGVDALRDVGIPSERIRHDSVEELVAAGS